MCGDVGVRASEAMECEGQCLNGGVCNNGVCQCSKKYEGPVCQFALDGDDAGLDLDQGVFTFYAVMIILILIIGGAAYYLMMKGSRGIFSPDDGRATGPNNGQPRLQGGF